MRDIIIPLSTMDRRQLAVLGVSVLIGLALFTGLVLALFG